MTEIWRDIPGLEGRYQASTLGRIKSCGCQLNNSGTSLPVVCVDTGETFLSIAEASRKTGIDGSSIAKCCKGRYLTTHNLTWRYL